MITLPTLLFVTAGTALALAWRRAAGAARDQARQLALARNEVQALRHELEVSRAKLAALAHSESQLQHIVSLLPVALFQKDPDSRIIMMNQACEQIFGVDFAKLSGTQGSEHYPAGQMESFLAADRAAFASGQLHVEEEWVWHAGRQEDRRVQTYKRPVYDSDGKPALLIGMCIDVTDRMRADLALQETLRQLRQLSDHRETTREEEHRRLARYAHDALGQNLMALKLDADMLHARTARHHPRLHSQAGGALTTLEASIHAVRTLINELHPSTLELGLPAAVDWLLKQMERNGGIHSQLHLLHNAEHETLPPRETWAVFRMIQVALANIAANAHATRVDVTLDLGPDVVLVVVGDNGIGLTPTSEPNREQNGEPFGMLALRERVSAFGGVIVASNMPGKGTTLTIRLPGMQKREAAASRFPESCHA
ncbi:MAG: PAS domain-containing protein [Burkholderiaceae bacterium]|nr:PAS domain-containing protein [Burkholderiaceae bacterium]